MRERVAAVGLMSPLRPVGPGREVKKTGDALQAAIDEDTEVDAAGQWRTALRAELPGEADAV